MILTLLAFVALAAGFLAVLAGGFLAAFPAAPVAALVGLAFVAAFFFVEFPGLDFPGFLAGVFVVRGFLGGFAAGSFGACECLEPPRRRSRSNA